MRSAIALASAWARAAYSLFQFSRQRRFAHVADPHLLAVVGAEHDDDRGRFFALDEFRDLAGQLKKSSRTKPEEPLERSTTRMRGFWAKTSVRPSASPLPMKSPTTRTVRASSCFSTTGISGSAGTATRGLFLRALVLRAFGATTSSASTRRDFRGLKRSRSDHGRLTSFCSCAEATEATVSGTAADRTASAASSTSHRNANLRPAGRSHMPSPLFARLRRGQDQALAPAQPRQHFHARMPSGVNPAAC